MQFGEFGDGFGERFRVGVFVLMVLFRLSGFWGGFLTAGGQCKGEACKQAELPVEGSHGEAF
jgi:hypothetical protein